MTSASITSPRRAAPRGAEPLAGLAAGLYLWAQRRFAELRVRHEERQALRTAHALRVVAERLRWTEPGLSSDLRAVAERFDASRDQ